MPLKYRCMFKTNQQLRLTYLKVHGLVYTHFQLHTPICPLHWLVGLSHHVSINQSFMSSFQVSSQLGLRCKHYKRPTWSLCWMNINGLPIVWTIESVFVSIFKASKLLSSNNTCLWAFAPKKDMRYSNMVVSWTPIYWVGM